MNEEAASLDWTKSRGQTSSGIRHSENYEDDFYVENRRSSQKVGGNMSTLLEDARASSVVAAYRRMVNASANNVEAFETHDEPDTEDSGSIIHNGNENVGNQNPVAHGKLAYERDPGGFSSNQNKLESDPDDSHHGETMQVKHLSQSNKINSQNNLGKSAAVSSSEEPDPDDSGNSSSFGSVVKPVVEILDTNIMTSKTIDEPDPDDTEARNDHGHYITTETLEDQVHFNQSNEEPDPVQTNVNEITQVEPRSDDKLVPQLGISDMNIDEPDPDDEELQRIRDSVSGVCSRLRKAIEMLQVEVNPTEATIVLQTLFKIIRYDPCYSPSILFFPFLKTQ